VLVKLALCGALEGIGSVHELLRVAAMRLDLRRFLGYFRQLETRASQARRARRRAATRR
jgi:hypothetical protein